VKLVIAIRYQNLGFRFRFQYQNCASIFQLGSVASHQRGKVYFVICECAFVIVGLGSLSLRCHFNVIVCGAIILS